MKDFIKIFIGLVLLVGAFSLGKDYGIKSITQTTEYKQQLTAFTQLQQKEEQLLKIKLEFQKLLDTTDLKQAHEVLGKMVIVLLADLALRISKEQEDQLAIGKNYCIAGSVAQASAASSAKATSLPVVPEKPVIQITPHKTPWTSLRTNQFKTQEWLAMNAGSERQSLRQLARSEIKNMNAFIEQGERAGAEKYTDFVGEYKGTIQDIKNQVYATLTTKIKLHPSGGKSRLSVDTVIIRDGQESSRSSTGNEFGWQHPEVQALVIEQSKDRYLQIYKIQGNQKLAGNYYEVLPNGTTKMIGQFSLSRIDDF